MTFQNPDQYERHALDDEDAAPGPEVEVVHALALEETVARLHWRGDHIIRVRAFSTPFGDMDDDGDYDDQVLELGQARDAHSRLALFLAQAPLMFDFFEIEFDPAAVAGRA
ncbi:MAG: hypothetical protein EON88_25155 [Brevundimonas sp.]|nr:MAG: hypothetical protein EON88_25155 [Brevundimonas sp.]